MWIMKLTFKSKIAKSKTLYLELILKSKLSTKKKKTNIKSYQLI